LTSIQLSLGSNQDRQTDLASAHYIIDDNGSIVQMVKLEDAAYHAGISKWTIDSKEYTNSRINDISIGIELVGDGNKMVYSEYQYQSLIRLLYELTYDGQIKSIVGHSDIAPGRKTDPGVYFDWDRIRKCHYGHLVKR
jgi:AmpD protein